jgi:hypothetical protein
MRKYVDACEWVGTIDIAARHTGTCKSRGTTSSAFGVERPDEMKYRQLGNSNIDVSTVCMGGWSISTNPLNIGLEPTSEQVAPAESAP